MISVNWTAWHVARLDIDERGRVTASEMPASAGIYAAFARDGELLYIGQSLNLRRRWLNHHRQDLMAAGMAELRWTSCQSRDVHELEALLINALRPSLNRTVPAVREPNLHDCSEAMRMLEEGRKEQLENAAVEELFKQHVRGTRGRDRIAATDEFIRLAATGGFSRALS